MARHTTPSQSSSSRVLAALLTFLLLPAVIHGQNSFSCTDFLPESSWDAAAAAAPFSDNSTQLSITADDAAANTALITLTNTLAESQLCTLFSIFYSTDRTKRFYIPVGRSYDGRAWERVAGKHASLAYTCPGGNVCTVTLPNVAGEDATEYYMAAYKYAPTPKQKLVRFYERATFGGRESEVSGGDASASAMADLIVGWNAMNSTSHREYFRQRLNPRSVEIYKYGRTGPHPCDLNSRWRSFAFTRKDKVMSMGIGDYAKYGTLEYDDKWPEILHNATLEERTGSSSKFVWLYDGHVRTVLDSRPKWTNTEDYTTGDDIVDGSYRVCDVDEAPGSTYTDTDEKKRTLYAKFKLEDHNDGDGCKHVFGGNPNVQLDLAYMGANNPNNPPTPSPADPAEPNPYILDFTGLNLADIGYDPSKVGGIGYTYPKTKGTSVKLLTVDTVRTTPATNDDICTAVPDPKNSDSRNMGWLYSPYYRGQEHPDWDPASRSHLDQPVFAKVADSVYYIHDRRLTPLKNTIADPLIDGGGTQAIESVFMDINDFDDDDAELTPADHDENPRTKSLISGNENAILCSNDRPNVFNEGSCVLSTDENACVREDSGTEDTVVVMRLTPAAVVALNEILQEDGMSASQGNGFVAIVKGQDFVADTPLPCTMDAVSRWVVTQDAEAGCPTSGGGSDGTKAAFQHLLKHAVTNNGFIDGNGNHGVRDLRMYEAFPSMACDTADLDSHSFKVWVSDGGGTCYENVHPDDNDVYMIKFSGAWTAISGTDGTITVAMWVTVQDDDGEDYDKFEYLGREGDYVDLDVVMAALGVYEAEGGLPVTAAPTSQPSAPPTEGPSMSVSPSSRPSGVPTSSDAPSSSAQPSSIPSSSAGPSRTAIEPSFGPSTSLEPSSGPSTSAGPTNIASDVPSNMGASPSAKPSIMPSASIVPSDEPTDAHPSANPSASSEPSYVPSSSSEPTLPPSQESQIARTRHDVVYKEIANHASISSVILETQNTLKTGGVLVCGSSGEIEPDFIEDDYFDYWNRILDSSGPESEQKKTVFVNIALTAQDQLCQRTAWALSQIFQISPDFLGYGSLSEAHTNYYDGFVRNCNGSYKEVMKTVAFSVKMGMQLSHVDSTSLRTAYDASNEVRFPDENFARECMQLETIGLDMLNMDGTHQLDPGGNSIPTYDTNDILTMARAWTGYEYASRRGNYEEKNELMINWNDPMQLKDGERHDWFPKEDLTNAGWLGDRYPLCSDLPDKAFLKAGATFKLLGRSSVPRYQFDKGDWADEVAKKLTLSSTSSGLYAALCAATSGSPLICTYPATVTLALDITTCDDPALNLVECDVDTVRVVQVSQDVFYEYVRVPCVHHAFFEAEMSKAVFAGGADGAMMCAHKTQPVATKTCCTDGSDCYISCKYHGEAVSFDTNAQRCGSGNLCAAGTQNCNDSACNGQKRYDSNHPKNNHFQWTDGGCDIKVKVRLDGMVALVHVPLPANSHDEVVQYVEKGVKNMNYFHLPWPRDAYAGDELFPTTENQCGENTCIEQDDWTCLCDVTVTNGVAFSSASFTNLTSVEDIRSKCKIGSFPPGYLMGYDVGEPVTISGDSVKVYHKLSGPEWSEDTIFMLDDETDEFFDFGSNYVETEAPSAVGRVYLKNLVSEIQLGDVNNDYYTRQIREPLIMRNPIMFHDLVAPEIRDAHYEIDALIHHLTSHQNAPPFIALQLIQHIATIANPSPGMIERVARAYKNGKFEFEQGTKTFGDGRFGNLNAVVAAILLDPEAISSTLDADPVYGGMKEPIIKVLQVMRALEYKQTPHDRNIYPKLNGMVDKVGQMAYESPDQFSFFLPDYSPPGDFAVAGIYAPPTQVLTMSTTVATTEGLWALMRDGLSAASEGFGYNNFETGVLDPGDHSGSVGHLSYIQSGVTDREIVQDIADLLTAGRLSTGAVTRITTEIGHSLDPNIKKMLAQQLISTSPEFHTTNRFARNGKNRAPTPRQDRSDEPYKAVVILFAAGGLDSFNVLTPHTTCELYTSYRKNRGLLSLRDKEMLPIQNGPIEQPLDQPCETFGVNINIPILKTIYNNGHGQFHANIGHLSKPVTKGNWRTETQTHLFSHKTMEREAQLVDAFQEDGWSTGVGGRMLDVLQNRNFSVSAIGIDSKGSILEGNPSTGRTVDVISSGSVNTLSRRALDSMDLDLESILPMMEYLNQDTDFETSGLFANYWAQNLVDVLNKTDELKDMLNGVSLNQPFSGQLSMVAKLMILNEERNVNRDVFLVHSGGHDGHSLGKNIMNDLLPGINAGIEGFYNELHSRDMLRNVTFVLMSEFGRSITPNSGRGSDHAWGGNAFVWGGDISGAKILGKFPKSFDNTDLNNIGRGLLIPSRSWESMWYGVANWMGIRDDAEMEVVLPNNGNMGCELYTDKDMYDEGTTTINGCNDRAVTFKLTMLLAVPRYLTGLEQKKICRAAIALTNAEAGAPSRCVVTDQHVVVNFDNGESNARRVLTGVSNNTIQGTVEMKYDNPANSTAGSEYLESDSAFNKDMNDLIANGDNCAAGQAGSRNRRLSSHGCAFGIEDCQGIDMTPEVTEAPSFFPSTSSQPSDEPSGLPSGDPTQYPSGLPSDLPTQRPSTTKFPTRDPSLTPSKSLSPTPPQPSSKPSVAPSDRPTRLCTNVVEDCSNGGMWSPFSCECLCLSPFCPNEDGWCGSTTCLVNYHQTLFDDQPAPWFYYGSSCTPTKDLPSSVSAIYRTKALCCKEEWPDNTGGCVSRPAGVLQLTYNGILKLVGLSCPNSGSERAASAGNIANSILSVICSQSGLVCGDGDRVVVIRFCGQEYSIAADYTEGRRRRLQTFDVDDNTVQWTFISTELEYDTLRGIELVLSAYLKGTTLTGFVAAVLAGIQANSPPASLQAVTGLVYEAVNAFIAGLGLYYPAWGHLETCLSDGNQEPYMNRNHDSWLYATIEGCCGRYYGWDLVGCKLRNAEATLVSGTISDTIDPSDKLYFPDWGKTDTCINDGSAPPYMKKQHSLWMYSTLGDCCRAYYGWTGGFVECMTSTGLPAPTSSPIGEAWYIDWIGFKCVRSCKGPSPCGGHHKTWDTLHQSRSQCCATHLWWKERGECMRD